MKAGLYSFSLIQFEIDTFFRLYSKKEINSVFFSIILEKNYLCGKRFEYGR